MASRVKSLYAVPVVLAVVAVVVLAVWAVAPALARGHHWRPWPSHAPTSPSPAPSSPSITPSRSLSTPSPAVSSPASVTSSPAPSTSSRAPSPATRTPTAPGGSPYPADESTTGYQNAPGYPGKLADCSGTAIQSNTTYSFCNFPGGLRIPAGVTGVTFTGCRFASNDAADADVADYGSAITFSYDTFEPSTVPAGSEPAISNPAYAIPYSQGYQYGIDQRASGALTVDHSRFWGFANAMQVWSSTATAPLRITNSLFQNPRNDGGIDHTDGPGVLNGPQHPDQVRDREQHDHRHREHERPGIPAGGRLQQVC